MRLVSDRQRVATQSSVSRLFLAILSFSGSLVLLSAKAQTHKGLAASSHDGPSAAAAVEIFREAAELISKHTIKPVTLPQVTEKALKELLYKEGRDPEVATGISALDVESALRRFAEVVSSLADEGASGRSPASLAERAIYFYCRAADSYGEYVDSAAMSLASRLGGSASGGVGISLLVRDGEFFCFPLPMSVAERRGIKSGDRLLRVGGRDIRRSSLFEIGALVRGEPGTPVVLGVLRTFGREADVEIIREVQNYPVVIVEKELGNLVFRIRKITTSATTELRQAMQAGAADGRKNFTIDLRGCPGGDLDAVLQLADLFLSPNTPMGYLVERSGTTPFYATTAEALGFERLTILQDKGTASAAELLISCLIETFGSERVLTHGEKSFGKAAVISSLPPLRGGGQLQVTSGRLFAPSGRSWEGVGLMPSQENGGAIFAANVVAELPPMASSGSGAQHTTPSTSPPPKPASDPAGNFEEPIEMVPVGKGSGRF